MSEKYTRIENFTGYVYGVGEHRWDSIWVEDYNVIELRGYYYDEKFFEENFRICTHCGDIVRVSNIPEDHPDGCDGWCSYCINEKFLYCMGHKRWELREDIDNRTYWVYKVGNICEEYYLANCTQCSCCGTDMLKTDVFTGTDDDGEECIVCENCYKGSKSRIRNYHRTSDERKGKFLIDFDRTSKPGIGWEWEMHSPDYGDEGETAEIISDYFNDGKTHFFFEEDCSIDPGVEAIARPATAEYWEGNFETLKQACKELVHFGCRSHNGGDCGLHVHIDRKYFGNKPVHQELAEAKFLWIFAKWWDNMVKFSRRRNFEYCEKLYTGTKTIPSIVKYSKDDACGHYTAVNIGNRDTIELRLWRGTLKPETILATLKFSSRLAELVKNKTVNELNDMEWEDFLGDDEVILSYWETVKNRT